ncbi:hypothetical protein [Streptomyces sp. NPDC053720]|uniref:hypothetical protein n=1 Tax=Streptomyces sp. NPDC053720 TaxID=3154855 RepID=UPI0034248864
MQSFADSSGRSPELLRARGAKALARGARTITTIHRLLLEAAVPLRRPDPVLSR